MLHTAGSNVNQEVIAMYCPYCGWELRILRVKDHKVYDTVHQCPNGVCQAHSTFLVIEEVYDLSDEDILSRIEEEGEESEED